MLDRVLELPHVARPVVLAESANGVRAEALGMALHAARILLEVVAREQEHVVPPLAQGR